MGNYDNIVDYMYFACIKTKEFVLKKIILFNTNLYNFTTAYYQKKNKRLPRCYGAPGLWHTTKIHQYHRIISTNQ